MNLEQKIDHYIKEAMRSGRDSAIKACIELCELTAEQGGCARCCVDQLTQWRKEMLAADLVHDALEKARNA